MAMLPMENTAKRLFRLFIPPVLLDIKRRFARPDPMFVGVHNRADVIANESPWDSTERLAYCTQQLRNIAGDTVATPLASASLVTCVLINILAKPERPVHVLDFGGGTGFVYFNLLPHFTHPDSVRWTVVDNPQLRQIGEHYRGPRDRITFTDTIHTSQSIDVVHVNTSLQFLDAPLATLAALADLKPSHIVLTRLVAGDVPSFFTQQRNIHGRSAACAFLNIHEIRAILAERGYSLVHRSGAAEDQWGPALYENVPQELQLRNCTNLIFRIEPV